MRGLILTTVVAPYRVFAVLTANSSGDNQPLQPLTSALMQAATTEHYENFPVASWLCPPHLRAPIASIYVFARTADDIADEGCAPAHQRLDQLHQYREQLHAIARGSAPQAPWEHVFAPLQQHIQRYQLPVTLLDDLLSAFMQDIEKTRDASTYAQRDELLDYCRRSANPIGRLLLHLYGVHDQRAHTQSDAICTALQLINFWQDLSVDIPRARHYLTDADCNAFGVTRAQLLEQQVTPNIEQLIAANTQWAKALMLQGAPLVHQLPGRIGWELRLVVQGGLCILNKVDALQGASLHTRPTVGKRDWPTLLWRALRMSRS